MKPRKKYWYHCSDAFHGEIWEVGKTSPIIYGEDEPSMPRLCVAESVTQCFAAKLFFGNVNVYRTEKPKSAIKPKGVWDSVITQERWLIPPVKMILMNVIPADTVNRANVFIKSWLKEEREPTALIRLYSYRDILEVLPKSFQLKWEKRFVDKAISYFEEKLYAAL